MASCPFFDEGLWPACWNTSGASIFIWDLTEAIRLRFTSNDPITDAGSVQKPIPGMMSLGLVKRRIRLLQILRKSGRVRD